MTNFTKLAMLFPLSLIIVALCANAAAQQHLTGTLPDGATYVIDVDPQCGMALCFSTATDT